jgi:hypothetical protein
MVKFTSADDRRQNYQSTSSGKTKKSSSQKKSTPSNTGNNREDNRVNQYTNYTKKQIADGRKKVAKDKIKDGRSSLDNLKFNKVPPLVPGSTILNAIGQKSLDKNVDFFKNDPRTNKARNKYGVTEQGYKNYMKDRLDGKIDAAGNVNSGYGRDRNNNVQTQKVTAGGQTILTKEKTPEETKVAEEKKEYDARQTKKKGRRKNTLTSSQGVMKTSADYSLGKKSLLGQVV